MNDRNERFAEQRLEAYLDGLLTGPERAAFEERLRNGPQLAELVQLQSRIDASLQRLQSSSEPSPEHLAELQERFTTATGSIDRSRPVPRWAIGLAAAASIAAALFIWRPFGWGVSEPYFQPQPVAQVYAQTVEKGFTPYYKCDDADRFAEVFRRRQGRVLQLLPLSAGTEMLGVSYPGGLSRDSTAMLCLVHGRPVMVLVDRASADRPEAMQNGDPAIRVFRAERDGLVFYEVTPFATAQMIDHLAIAENTNRVP
jgi:hypothetical protein